MLLWQSHINRTHRHVLLACSNFFCRLVHYNLCQTVEKPSFIKFSITKKLMAACSKLSRFYVLTSLLEFSFLVLIGSYDQFVDTKMALTKLQCNNLWSLKIYLGHCSCCPGPKPHKDCLNVERTCKMVKSIIIQDLILLDTLWLLCLNSVFTRLVCILIRF